MQTAMVNRSIRTIKAVGPCYDNMISHALTIPGARIPGRCLGHFSPDPITTSSDRFPAQTALHAPISVGAVPTVAPVPGAPQPPTAAMDNTSIRDNKQSWEPQPAPSPAPSPAPPPAYGQPPPSMPPLCQATALYPYKGEDEGDLTLQPNRPHRGDRVHERRVVEGPVDTHGRRGASSRAPTSALKSRG